MNFVSLKIKSKKVSSSHVGEMSKANLCWPNMSIAEIFIDQRFIKIENSEKTMSDLRGFIPIRVKIVIGLILSRPGKKKRSKSEDEKSKLISAILLQVFDLWDVYFGMKNIDLKILTLGK